MLSTSVIKNVGQASHYFASEDNYYTQEEGTKKSEWWGKSANQLGLEGKVDAERFTQLLQGRLSNGEQLGKVVDGEIKHRAGWDLTFSVPKSVSILALVGKDERLQEAHRQAVSSTLSQIERGCSQARVKNKDVLSYQNTANVVAALFHHDLSRAQDPQLHTHAVVMNMTQRLDGKWRSQASQMGRYGEKTNAEVNGFIERVRHNKRYYGQLYRTELAYQVSQLGYELDVDKNTGLFEIAGVPEGAIKAFSQRRGEIEKYLTSNNLAGGKASAVATLKTREAKHEVDRGELHQAWEIDASKQGLNCKTLIDQSLVREQAPGVAVSKQNFTEMNDKASKLVLESAKEMATFQSTFAFDELVTKIATEAVKNKQSLNMASILQSVEANIENGCLISIANDQGKTILMAKTTVEDEKRLFEGLAQNQMKTKPVSDSSLSQFLVQHNELDTVEQKAIMMAFSDDRVVLIEGQEGKDRLLKPVVKIARANQVNLMVLSPNQIGSKAFAQSTKQTPHTLWEQVKSFFVDTTPHQDSVMGFLSKANEGKLKRMPDMVLVDNAHLLSTHQKANLVEWGAKEDKKILLFGNLKTLLPQQTGTSIRQLAEHGVKTIRFSQRVQVQEKINPDILASRIIEVKDKAERQTMMALHYSKMEPTLRQQSWLVANNKTSVGDLNDLAHQMLKDNGHIDKVFDAMVLLPVFVANEKKEQASTYQNNMVIRFNESYRSLSVKAGEYLKVVRHSAYSNRVILEKENGDRTVWQPDKLAGNKGGAIELFKESKREIGVGETIVLQRSMRQMGLVKGDRLVIQGKFRNRIKIEDTNGKSHILDLSKASHRHLDYGYAATLHSIAHDKPHTLITEFNANSVHTNQRHLYQAVTQPKETWVYTDNTKTLSNQFNKQTGDKLSAHAILKNADEFKKNLQSIHAILEKQLIKDPTKKNFDDLAKNSMKAIHYAIHHLAEREAGFTHKNVMEVAMSHALGKVNQTMLDQAMLAMEKEGIVLRGSRNDGTLWTTLTAVKMEQEILSLASQDQGKLTAMAKNETIDRLCQANQLNSEQGKAVKDITQSKDRILSVQGYAGTGKTTMLATVSQVLSESKASNQKSYKLLGLAPTHTAVKELTNRNIEARTLDSFINEIRNEGKGTVEKRPELVLVLDESSMVSNRKMLEILAITHELDCRQVVMGDTRQLPSPESGKPQSLVQTQMEPIRLSNIRRQENELLKKAIKETIHYDFKAAFATLKESIIEVGTPSDTMGAGKQDPREARLERVNRLVKDYFSYPETERHNIQVITPGHDDRVLANTLIREQLWHDGSLQGERSNLQVLSNKNMTSVERSHAKNFIKGDVVRFGKAQSMDIKSGQYFHVLDINKEQNFLTLAREDGKLVAWQIPEFDKRRLSDIEVFKTETRDLCVGDTIRWSRSDKKNELYSTETAHVSKIKDGKITVQLGNNKTMTFNPSERQFQHWDHGYASTVYAAQGKTKSIVLAHLESFRKNLTTQPSFLVALTRAVNEFKIYTDNAENLLTTIAKNHGIKLSSLEVIGKYPDKSNQVNKKNIPEKTSPTTAFKRKTSFSPRFDRNTIEQIKERLNNDAEQVAISILGEPKAKVGTQLRFGRNQGSLVVTVKGNKQGWWHDFSSDRVNSKSGGRDMLSFIQCHTDMDKKTVLSYAAKLTGIVPDLDSVKSIQPLKQKNSLKSPQAVKKEQVQEEKRRTQFARKLAGQSLPAKGTLVERYIKDHRGITLDTLPEDIRFHPGIYSKINNQTLPAMLVVARNAAGNIQAVQATYLDNKTGNKASEDVAKVQKQTFGLLTGSTVTLSNKNGAPTLIAEGTETGLSLVQALPEVNVKVTLGKSNLLNIDSKTVGDKVTLCLDNDGKDLRTDPVISTAVNQLANKGKEVTMMAPMPLDGVKQDYNDVLKSGGVTAVQRDFDVKLSADKFYGQENGLTKMRSREIELEN